MKRDYLISIIVPVFNVEKYLERCVDSLINQTYKNIEIILVDDGSTDSSGAICDQLDEKDERIRVIHKKNGGLSSARNAGVRISQGDYIGFVDSDDYVDCSMYEILLDDICTYGADISQCGCAIIWEDRIEYRNGTDKLYIWDRKEALIELLKGTLIEPSVCNKLYKRGIFRKLEFDETIRLSEDVPFNIQAFLSIHRSTFRDRPLYQYEKREGSLTGGNFKETEIYTITNLKRALKNLKNEDDKVLEYGLIKLCASYISVYNHSIYAPKDYSGLRKHIKKALEHYEYKMICSRNCRFRIKAATILIIHYEMVYRILEKQRRIWVAHRRKRMSIKGRNK